MWTTTALSALAQTGGRPLYLNQVSVSKKPCSHCEGCLKQLIWKVHSAKATQSSLYVFIIIMFRIIRYLSLFSFLCFIISASISGPNTETTIACTSSSTPLTGLTWMFNHSQIILTQTGANVPYNVSEEWRQQVKSVSESGSLTLQDLSSYQEGIYTCELSNAKETHITNTFLKLEKSQGKLAWTRNCYLYYLV